MKKCIECGNRSFETSTVDHDVDVLVRVQAQQHTCTECGEVYVDIPDLERLYHSVAQSFARQRERLAPEQIKWLRKFIGFSGQDFAERVDVARETVSQWENGHSTMNYAAEVLLRVMAANGDVFKDYEPEPSEPKVITFNPIPFHANSRGEWVRA